MINDMYSKYLKEIENKETITTKFGFATYQLFDQAVYLVDIYILPEYRRNRLVGILEEAVIEIGKAYGCSTILGSISLNLKKKHFFRSKAMMHTYGYKFKSLDRNHKIIYMSKEI